MSADDPGPPLEQVFVELLDEGTTCLRPTFAVILRDGTYRLLPTPAYDPDNEHWEFPPGTVVRCRRERWSSGEVLVARERVEGA